MKLLSDEKLVCGCGKLGVFNRAMLGHAKSWFSHKLCCMAALLLCACYNCDGILKWERYDGPLSNCMTPKPLQLNSKLPRRLKTEAAMLGHILKITYALDSKHAFNDK